MASGNTSKSLGPLGLDLDRVIHYGDLGSVPGFEDFCRCPLLSGRYSGDGGTCMSPVTKVFRVSRSTTQTQIDRWIPSEAGSIAADEDKAING